MYDQDELSKLEAELNFAEEQLDELGRIPDYVKTLREIRKRAVDAGAVQSAIDVITVSIGLMQPFLIEPDFLHRAEDGHGDS